MSVHFPDQKPRWRKAQRDTKDPKLKTKVVGKLEKARHRRYIAPGHVVSLTAFFGVPKGDDDLRMVYDGTVSGLNDLMWVLRFGMSTIDTHLRSLDAGTFMANVDVGKCFLNFVLHESIRELAGVDLTLYFGDVMSSPIWEVWARALMGAKSSPYQACQGVCIADEVMPGKRRDKDNVFQWEKVRLNCPGQKDYKPSLSWVSKVRRDGKIASDFVSFVDDFRPSGPSKAEAWRAASKTATTLNYLGLQDAPQKRRDSSQMPGAWTGSVVRTGPNGVELTILEKKWRKALEMIDEVLAMLAENPNKLNRKRLEHIRGFLVYAMRTYLCTVPYLIGLHMSIDGWRDGRDAEGWRLKKKKTGEDSKDDTRWKLATLWEDLKDEDGQTVSVDKEGNQASSEAYLSGPDMVNAVPRLENDMKALKMLLDGVAPPVRLVRCTQRNEFYYGFGDASGSSFGATFENKGIVEFKYGQWCTEEAENSSN